MINRRGNEDVPSIKCIAVPSHHVALVASTYLTLGAHNDNCKGHVLDGAGLDLVVTIGYNCVKEEVIVGTYWGIWFFMIIIRKYHLYEGSPPEIENGPDSKLRSGKDENVTVPSVDSLASK